MTDRGPRGRLAALTLFLLIVSALGCGAASEIQSIPDGSLIVDVRTPREYQRWHFPGAINIPVSELSERTSEIGDKSRTIVVYCRSGSRSSHAKQMLIDAGYTDVKNGGGLRDMKKLVPPKQQRAY
jgi:phage shock protein E